MNQLPTTPEPNDMTELVNLELKEQESQVDNSERARKAEYLRKWREDHRERTREYNKKYYNKQKEEANDFYNVVRELRSFKLRCDNLEASNKELISLIKELTSKVDAFSKDKPSITRQPPMTHEQYIELLKVEIELAREQKLARQQKSIKPIEQSQNLIIPENQENQEKTPVQSPVQSRPPSPVPIIQEPKKIKKVRKIKPKSSIKPPSPTSSEASSVTPVKLTKNMINEMLEDLIDSDGNIIPSETETD